MKLTTALLDLLLCQFLFGNAVTQDRVIVATLRSVSQWSFWIALESGFYKELGIDVVPVAFNGGTRTIASLVSGDVQNGLYRRSGAA